MLRELAVILRGFAHQRAFTAATIATLVVGIAAPIALFSTVNAVLLQPLPYPRAGDIYTVRTTITDGRYTSGLTATAELAGLAASTGDVLHATGAIPIDETFIAAAGPVQAAGYAVWRDFFELFGLPLALGRVFAPHEHVWKSERLVVLAHRTWRRHFGADPGIIGTTVRTSGGTLRVVGVAAAALDVPAGADFWINLQRGPDAIGHELYGYLRLRPGARVDGLRDPMARVMSDLAVKYPEQNRNRVFVLTPILDDVVGDLGSILVVVFGATGLLLALACLNVTNLLLARAAFRMREMAVRAALGASRWRIVRHALIESLLLAVAGGSLGILAAYAGVELLMAFGASEMPRLDRVPFDTAVWLFALGTTLATGLVVGVVPALRISGTDPSAVMNEEGRSGTIPPRTRRLLGSFVALEAAIGVTLVAGTGLMIRSYSNLRSAEAGFTFDERLIADVLLPVRYADPERQEQWFDEMAGRIRARSATGVAAASSLPLRPERDTTTFIDIVSRPVTDPHQRPNARLRVVTPGLFSLLGTRIVAGRPFSRADTHRARAVAIVNEAFVRRFMADADPLRETIRVPGFRMQRTEQGVTFGEVAIVGIVEDVRHAALHLPAEQTVYLAHAQTPLRRPSLVVSALPGRLDDVRREVATVLRAADPEVSVVFSSMRQVVASSLSRDRAGMVLMALFGFAALVLVALGVFGVVGYVVAQRSREIAIRLALGARAPQILVGVVGQCVLLTSMGAAIGLGLTWWIGRTAAAYMHGVSGTEPVVWALSVATVLAAALGGALLPATRAAAVDPGSTLRSS